MAIGKNKRNSTPRRKRDIEEVEDVVPTERNVSIEAIRGVVAIFFVAIASLLVLAQFGGGGTVGASLYAWLSWLLGVGYLLLPFSLILLASTIFRSLERHFGWTQLISMLIFLLSSLGLISIAFTDKGGVLGWAVSTPLMAAIDTTASVIFLLAFLVASLVVAYNVHLGLVFEGLKDALRGRLSSDAHEGVADATAEIQNVPVTGLPPADSEATTVAPPTPATHENEDTEESSKGTNKLMESVSSYFKSDAPADGFPITAVVGQAYTPPPISLLSKNKGKPEVGDVKANMNIIKRTLQNFGIQVEMDEASIGPTVTRYAMKPAEGVRLAKIVALQSNLELALAASPVRIEAPIPGKSLVGIEVPNIARTTLGLGPLMAEPSFTQSEKPLLMCLGRSITGAPHFADLARMPHLLVAGATGAGKSVTIHDFIVSLLYRCGPEKLRFVMVDPKRVELTLYNQIPHLLTPVITDAKKAILALKWLAKEMDRRYNVLEAEAVRDISSYHTNVVAKALEKAQKNGSNEKMPEAMPYIVVVIDELADIMQTYPRELEAGIVRLAQMSRAVGIHLILSTQRPSVKVITGLIKANVPARVALQVASQIDSRTILDMGGAEKLLGAGDMLFLSGEMSKPTRIQAPYISEDEVKRSVAHIVKMSEGMLPSEIDFNERENGTDAIFSSMIGEEAEEEEEDELYQEAKRTVVEAGKASTSYLQRKLGVGYARAARLMDMLEDRGVIGPADGAKPREVIAGGASYDHINGSDTADDA